VRCCLNLTAYRASREIRARLGDLPGDFSCNPRLTGREFLEFCAAARAINGIGSGLLLAQRFEADLSRRVGDLSRGNRQKIGLIQALFHDPELLVLDEPTTGLDPLMQEEFLSVITEYRERSGTVFLSSHVVHLPTGEIRSTHRSMPVNSRAFRGSVNSPSLAAACPSRRQDRLIGS